MAGRDLSEKYLPPEAQIVCTDPWVRAVPTMRSSARAKVYSCLRRHINFIAATAEFQPFIAGGFDWVHLRSMIDHVQVPDLVMREAHRVLNRDGRILVGLRVEGGRSGYTPLTRRVRQSLKACLGSMGMGRLKDHHVWHPTYALLKQLILDNGFSIEDTYWQPYWQGSVCYICARKE